jgi:hypothetical protein
VAGEWHTLAEAEARDLPGDRGAGVARAAS